MSDNPIGGYFDMKAQQNANAVNQKEAAKMRKLNYKMFLQSRAYMTPKYFKTAEKDTAKGSKQLLHILDNQRGGLKEQLQRNRDIVSSYDPITEGANRTATGIFDRSLTNEALGYLDPVLAARSNQAELVAQASQQALQDQLAVNNAAAAQRGFVGDVSNDQLLDYEARRRNAETAAGARGLAGFQNAQDVYQLNQAGINQEVAHLGLPSQMVQQGLALENAPEAASVAAQMGRLGIFNQFKLGPAAPPYAQPNFVSPTATPLGLAATALGGAGNAYAGYKLYQNMMNRNQTTQATYPGGVDQQLGGEYNGFDMSGGGAGSGYSASGDFAP